MLHECWGAAALDEFADLNIEETAVFFLALGFTTEEARRLARRALATIGGARNSDGAIRVRDYFADVDQLAHKNADGTVSGWGRFWTHCLYLRWLGREFLAGRRLPCDPGTYVLDVDQWRKTNDQSWRLELNGIDANSAEATAASLASLAELSLQKMREKEFDCGNALDVAYHMGELHMEFLFRRFELVKLARTGHKVSQQGVRAEAQDRGDAIYEAFVGQPLPSHCALSFARSNFCRFGFPSASAAQRAISRRHRIPREKVKSRKRLQK